MNKVVESLYNSVGKYGIKLNEDLDNKKPIKEIKRRLKEEVMGLDNSNKVVYVAPRGQGIVNSLIKQIGYCFVISFNNTDEIPLIGNSPVIFDEIEKFDQDALKDAINILTNAPNKVVVVTYDPIIGLAFSDCGVKTINLLKNSTTNLLRNSIKEEYSLVGQDGNAFSLMGYTARCMKECGISKAEIDKMYKEATSGDYDNLLVVCDDYIQRCNAIAEEEGLFECADLNESVEEHNKLVDFINGLNENDKAAFSDSLNYDETLEEVLSDSEDYISCKIYYAIEDGNLDEDAIPTDVLYIVFDYMAQLNEDYAIAWMNGYNRAKNR